MIETMTGDQNGMDRRQFLGAMKGLATSAVLSALPAGLVGAVAQEAIRQKPYEKQEPKVASVEKIDAMVRDFSKNYKIGESSSTALNELIFGSDSESMLAGVQAFEQFDGGIQMNINIMRNRAKAYKLDTSSLDEAYNKALAIRNAAADAHIQFYRSLPEYMFALGIPSADTRVNAEKMHAAALTLARANDALVQFRDEIQKNMPR